MDHRLWAKVLLNVLRDKDHFNIPLEDCFLVDHHVAEVRNLLALARKHICAYQTFGVTCGVVKEPSLSDDVIRLRKSAQEKYCLEVLFTPQMTAKLDAISKGFKDPSQSLAPIFIPTIRTGPTPEIIGNYFLEEDPCSKCSQTNERLEEEDQNMVGEEFTCRAQNGSSVLNIFLVVEPHQLETVQATMEGLRRPSMNNVNLIYFVLPQRGRGIGVTRAVIKSLAGCFRFSLYLTNDDDIQFMYQFDGNSRRWYNCSITSECFKPV